MELYLNREIESYNDKEFPLEAIYSMCQQTNKWCEDTTNIETKSETQTAPPYGKFSMVYKTRLTWTGLREYTGEYIWECLGEYLGEYLGEHLGEHLGEYLGELLMVHFQRFTKQD